MAALLQSVTDQHGRHCEKTKNRQSAQWILSPVSDAFTVLPLRSVVSW